MDRKPAELFPPGEFIRDELEERGWTQDDLAEILGRSPKLVSEIISGRCSITPETAKGLGAAFGTNPEYWMNLQNSYLLWKAELPEAVSRKARLFSKGPIKEMARRQWIEWSDNIQVLEKRVRDFYEMSDLDGDPGSWSHAARKSTTYVTPRQRAWLFRAKKLAQVPPKGRFSTNSLGNALKALKTLMANAEDLRRVPHVLSEAGIRFMVIKPLAGSKIDGACFWLDESSPVIALSLRFDRIDWFWHVLLHEIVHVKNRDGLSGEQEPDVWNLKEMGIQSGDRPEEERRVDEAAADLAIPSAKLDDFVMRVSPLFSRYKIAGFAELNGVHPGIVVGQLQHRGAIGWSHSRDTLVPIRDIVTSIALTDGWGHNVPVL